MSQLRSLENVKKGLELNIIDEVQADWEALVDHLKLPDCTVRNLRHLNNNEAACRRVFELWLDGEGLPQNWHTIISVLKKMKRKRLAEEVKETLND